MQIKTNGKKMHEGSSSKWIGYVVVLLAGYLVWNTGVAMRHNSKLEDKMASLEWKAELLEESSRNLELQKNYYSSEEYQKKSLKENFNLVDEGEMVLIVKDLPEPKNATGNVFSELQKLNELINKY